MAFNLTQFNEIAAANNFSSYDALTWIAQHSFAIPFGIALIIIILAIVIAGAIQGSVGKVWWWIFFSWFIALGVFILGIMTGFLPYYLTYQ